MHSRTPMVGKLPRWAVVQAVRDELAALRAQLARVQRQRRMTGDREGKIPMSAQTIETRARLCVHRRCVESSMRRAWCFTQTRAGVPLAAFA
ncbi:MAG: hypothetical protein U0787_11900 [Polyangia bacterium]